MLAWKEKVAGRLAGLLADSPARASPGPAPAPAAVEPTQAIPFTAEHFTSPKKASLTSYVLSLLPTSYSGESGHETDSSSSVSLRPLPPESLPMRWRENDFTWKDLPLELNESGSESESGESNGNFSNSQVLQSYRSVNHSNDNEETSTSDSADTLHYLTEKSIFVSPKLFAFFQSSLPGTLKGCHWVLLYSAAPGSMEYL